MHIPHPYTDSIRYIACWCHMNIVYYQGPSYFTNSQGSDFPSLLSVQKIHEVQAGDLQRAKGAWATSLRTGYAPRCFHTTDDSMTTSLYENDIRRGNMGETMKKRCLFQVCTVCWLPPLASQGLPIWGASLCPLSRLRRRRAAKGVTLVSDVQDWWLAKALWNQHMGMDQYLLIPFLVGWTSIYQLFWGSPGVQGFDPHPYVFCRWWFRHTWLWRPLDLGCFLLHLLNGKAVIQWFQMIPGWLVGLVQGIT